MTTEQTIDPAVQQLIEANKAQQALLLEMQRELAELRAKVLPTEVVEDPSGFREYPRAVFKHHGKGSAAIEAGSKIAQIDHIDHHAKTVANEAELRAHVEDGWTLAPEWPGADAAPAPKKKTPKAA